QVCGHITGSVILHEGVLRVMKGGRIDGDVTAPAVTLDGSIAGTCDADMVDILENGHLDGCSGAPKAIHWRRYRDPLSYGS
ncbi:TPA: polymer-forming cytoskeletal protein, partial [Citrobacter amalonaticus]